MDGELIPWREARVHVLSQTLHHGMGVFEGIRAYDGSAGPAIFRLRDHVARLFNSAKIVAIDLPWTPEEMHAACVDVVRTNGFGACYLRPVVFLGGEQSGISAQGNKVHAAVIGWRWNDYMGPGAKTRGVRLKISSFCRHHVGAVLTKAKCNGLYVNSTLALHEARSLGFDDALMLDPFGCVAEASTSNLFMIRDGKFVTPPATSVLEGITRDTVIRLCKQLGHEVIERNITRDELYVADEAFLTGTACEVIPIREIDGRSIKACPGPLFTLISSRFEEATQDPTSPWLSLVSAETVA